MNKTPQTLVYIGTYTRDGAEGIYTMNLDPATGVMEPIAVTRGIENPSFLCLSPDGRCLYAVAEVKSHNGQNTGVVHAYSIDSSTGELSALNVQSAGGPGPCHISVDHSGRCVVVANYSGGSVAALPIEADGRLGPPASFFQHQGKGTNPDRQEGPHGHSAYPTPDNRFVLVPDLGLDKVMIYRLQAEEASLSPHDPAFIRIRDGHGPRHLDFHPNGRTVYVINEMGNSITSFAFEPEHCAFSEIGMVPTLPGDFTGESTCADIHVHPDGTFLYGSNRGHDSIVIYRIDAKTDELHYVAHELRNCSMPRNFNINPSGDLLLCGNQDKGCIATFRIDRETGLLEPTGPVTPVPSPVCIQFKTIA